jgi:hypothetical protein
LNQDHLEDQGPLRLLRHLVVLKALLLRVGQRVLRDLGDQRFLMVLMVLQVQVVQQDH